MLVLSRNIKESIMIGDVKVQIIDIGNGRVKLGIEADKSIPVWREELYKEMAEVKSLPTIKNSKTN